MGCQYYPLLIGILFFGRSHTTLQEERLAQQQEQAQTTQAQCQAILDDLDALPPGHHNRDLLYQRAYGTWSERNRDWSQVSTTSLPVCRKAARLEQETQAYAKAMQEEQEAKQAEIHRYGSALIYLQAIHPDIYQTHFDERGHLRSGLTASRLALQGFAAKLSRGHIAGLGFPLFFFVLSLVTSGIALGKVALFAQRRDVSRSWDPAIYHLREELFYHVGKGLEQLDEGEGHGIPVRLNGTEPRQ